MRAEGTAVRVFDDARNGAEKIHLASRIITRFKRGRGLLGESSGRKTKENCETESYTRTNVYGDYSCLQGIPFPRSKLIISPYYERER